MADPLSAYSIQSWLGSRPRGPLEDTVLREFETRPERIGIDHQTPVRP
jgi:hypothetical protein